MDQKDEGLDFGTYLVMCALIAMLKPVDGHVVLSGSELIAFEQTILKAWNDEDHNLHIQISRSPGEQIPAGSE